MKETPLELASTTEIIEELMGRATFAGILVLSDQENKGQIHDHFSIHSALSVEDSTTMLEVALNALVKREQEHDGTQA